MSLLDQSGVTGGGLDPYNVYAWFVNMDSMWTERFGNYDCLVYSVKRIVYFIDDNYLSHKVDIKVTLTSNQFQHL